MFWQEHLLRSREQNMLRKWTRGLDQRRRRHDSEPICRELIVFNNQNNHDALHSSYLKLFVTDFFDSHFNLSAAYFDFFDGHFNLSPA